jgi:hypothetical protein
MEGCKNMYIRRESIPYLSGLNGSAEKEKQGTKEK